MGHRKDMATEKEATGSYWPSRHKSESLLGANELVFSC